MSKFAEPGPHGVLDPLPGVQARGSRSYSYLALRERRRGAEGATALRRPATRHTPSPGAVND